MKPHCQWYLELINAQNRRSFLAKQYKLPVTELHTPPKQIHNNKYPNRNNNNRPVACKCRVIRIRNSETQQPPTLFSIYLHFEPRAHLSSVQVLLRPTFHNTVCLSVSQSIAELYLLHAPADDDAVPNWVKWIQISFLTYSYWMIFMQKQNTHNLWFTMVLAQVVTTTIILDLCTITYLVFTLHTKAPLCNESEIETLSPARWFSKSALFYQRFSTSGCWQDTSTSSSCCTTQVREIKDKRTLMSIMKWQFPRKLFKTQIFYREINLRLILHPRNIYYQCP